MALTLQQELGMRAPYIPMNPDADFRLNAPSADALLNLNNDFNPG